MSCDFVHDGMMVTVQSREPEPVDRNTNVADQLQVEKGKKGGGTGCCPVYLSPPVFLIIYAMEMRHAGTRAAHVRSVCVRVTPPVGSR